MKKSSIIIVGLLLIPAIAMLFTKEVNWSLADFAIMGALLFAIAFIVGLIKQKIAKQNHRMVLIALVIGFFLVIWAELAVGVFNTPFAGS